MKINVKKIVLAIVSIFILAFAYMTINTIIINKKHYEEYASNKLFPVRLLFVDKEKVSNNTSLNDVFKDHFDSIIYASNYDVPLKDNMIENDYYVIHLNKYINDQILPTLTSEVFAKYNLNGEVVDDIKYDSNTKTIRVPKKYYSNSKDLQVPVQGEFVGFVSKLDFKNINVALNVTDKITKTKNIKVNGYSTNIQFNIGNKNITKDDIEIYVNDDKNKMPTTTYEYDSRTNTVAFDYSALFLKNIDVKINKKSLLTKAVDKLANILYVDALTVKYYNLDSSDKKVFELASAPVNVQVGTTFTASLPTYYITQSDGTHYTQEYTNSVGYPWASHNNTESSSSGAISSITGDSGKQYTDTSDAGASANVTHAITLPDSLQNGNSIIRFGETRNIRLGCVHISQATSGVSGNSVDYTIKVLDYDATEKMLTLAFVSESLHGVSKYGSQSAWGAYTFKWNDSAKGYIAINKQYTTDSPSSTGSAKFEAYSADSNGTCDWNNRKGVSEYNSAKGQYLIGYDSTNKIGTLDYGNYCVVESDDGDAVRDYEISYSNEHTSGGRKHSLVSLSSSSTICSDCNNSATVATNNKRVLIGDSRTVGMCVALGAGNYTTCDFSENGGSAHSSGDNTFIAAVSKNLTWFKTDAVQNAINSAIATNKDIIILLGYNDYTYNANNYVSYVNEKANEWVSKGANVYFASVTNGSGDNSQVAAFNNTIKNGINANVTYLDLTGVTVPNEDHYGATVYKNIYNEIVSKTKSSTPGYTVYTTSQINNRAIRYCYRAKKVDAETNAVLSGFKFKMSGKSQTLEKNGTTDSNGITVFSDLLYQDYKLEETSSDGEKGYWNNSKNNSNNITISASNLTVMNYSNGTYSCPDNSETYTKKNNKQYYCIKVKKVDAITKQPIKDASFRTTINGNSQEHADNWDGKSDGYTTFFTETSSGSFDVIETKAPFGYSKYEGTLKATAKLLSRELTKSEAETECKNADPSTFSATSIPTYPDSKNILMWYKVTENETTRAPGAEFTVTNESGAKIYHTQAKENQTDKNGATKSCYVYSATSTGDNSDVFISDSNGEVCISGVDNVKYNITETKPSAYHTFSSSNELKNLSPSTVFTPMNSDNKVINKPTEFEFTKYVTSGDEDAWKNITTESLKKIEFNILDANGNVLSFIKTADGKYSYAGNDIDRPSGTQVTGLYLDDNRKFYIEHLPVGTYSVKEKANANGTCDCTIDGSNCIGFYTPTYKNESDYKFTITNCSNDGATASICTTHSSSKQRLDNIPTEIEFTKSDLYGYEDASDIVDFENDKERNDFDRIVFKLKDENGNYLKLVKVGNNGSCLTDDSYAEYRYVTDDLIPLLTDEQRANLTEELHTCGGHIKITHLCRGKKYYIEEVSVPENSVFTLPEKVEDRTREYNIPCCGDTTTKATTTIIEDKPTRVRFEKRDSKYNYLIPDETTTFNVYQCKKGTTCHPSDGISADMKLMKFSERAIINNDEEDPNDVAGLAGVEVYKAMSDSDVQKGQKYVTDLHPYHGILVLRYLPSGYNYVLLETVAPKNYTLPRGRDAETYFTVVNNTVEVKEIDMANTPTSLLIRKYSTDGTLLKGAKFKVYQGTTCDKNLSAMNQPKKEMNLKTIRDGLYEARPVEDTSIIQTCDDKNGTCSSIPVNEVTKLTYSDYLGTWSDFENSLNDNNEKIQLQEGEALIQYLEYGHCYILEEVQAPEGYSLPKNEEDRFSMITIEENEKYTKDTYKTLINTPTPFTFYKYDEYNKLLDGAEFKLQKLDDNKKYQDVTVTQVEKNGELYYKVDKSSTNKTITTKQGKATVYYLASGQYRIIETKAAPGKELTKNPNIATFFVDDSGNVYGNGIIVNKAKTQKIEVKNSSSAEYIMAIQTGTKVVRYGLIIVILAAALAGLMIIRKKIK